VKKTLADWINHALHVWKTGMPVITTLGRTADAVRLETFNESLV